MNAITPLVSSPVEQKEPYYGYLITPQRELLTWLSVVYRHAVAGSRESRSFLVELSERIPEYSFAPSGIKEGVEKITRIAATNQWNGELSSLSLSIYRGVCQLYFPEITDLT